MHTYIYIYIFTYIYTYTYIPASAFGHTGCSGLQKNHDRRFTYVYTHIIFFVCIHI